MSASGNRFFWNKNSDTYQDLHGEILQKEAKAWGVWRIPESELNVLGDLQGKKILEYGCGAAQWAIALTGSGYNVTGLDLSDRQLQHARINLQQKNIDIPLVQANGEVLPFRAAAFDVVFCDHGVMSFARPEDALKEVARVLKPDGLFVFCMTSPLRDLCWDEEKDTVTDRLYCNYFTMEKFKYEESTSYQYGYGKWIRLFVENGFIIEDLIELRAPANQKTTYKDFIDHSWARNWPAENIWKVRKL